MTVVEPMGYLDTLEDGHDEIIDLRTVFESDVDQTLAYELVGDAHEELVDASIQEWALHLRHVPQQYGATDITVRALGQLSGEQAVDTLALNVAPVNDWPVLASPLT